MNNSNKAVKLEEIFNTFNLKSIISFLTRIGTKSSTTIDNIFIDELQFNDYEVVSVSNRLSDHEVQLLSIQLPQICTGKNDVLYRRNINDYNKVDFNMKLSYEEWDLVFNSSDINTSFNQFLNIFLRHFYASFHLVKSKKKKNTQKPWITTGNKISCRNKRTLYAEVKKSTNPEIITYHKNYCKILTRVINLAKKMAYEKQILYSKNKARISWLAN
jgi:hypothetical protein